LGIFKSQRFPQGDLSLSFGGIALVVHVWAILNILIILPAWMLRASIWELAGAISYPLVAALLESSILWIGMVALSYILPKKWLADKFAVLSSSMVWFLCFWAIVLLGGFVRVLELSLTQILIGLFLVILSFGDLYYLVRRYERLEHRIKRLIRSVAILAYFYVFIDLLGVVVIVIRNL
jgi:hypothetical protein